MFKDRHFDHSVILLCIRWYLTYELSLRDLEEMMAERGSLSPDGNDCGALRDFRFFYALVNAVSTLVRVEKGLGTNLNLD